MRVIHPSAVANSSSPFGPALTLTHCWRLLVFLMVSGLLARPGIAAQSEDPTIAALKRGESTYFTAKIQNLTDQLHLTESQQTRLGPIAEQETAYIEEIRMNPVMSLKEKFKRLKEIVRNSDNEMKHFLSAQQWQRLQSLRKDQKATLESYVNTR